MTASVSEKAFFRTRLAGNETSMPDVYVDEVFGLIEEEYAGYSRSVIKYAAVVQGVDDLIMAASTEVDYEEGDASEKRSQVVKNLQTARANFVAKRDSLIEKSKVAARWGGLRKRDEYRDGPLRNG